MMTSLDFPDRRVLRVLLYPRVYLPDFITSARRELMDSCWFFPFFGMVTCDPHSQLSPVVTASSQRIYNAMKTKIHPHIPQYNRQHPQARPHDAPRRSQLRTWLLDHRLSMRAGRKKAWGGRLAEFKVTFALKKWIM